ncbi:MAG: hypothetical protein ACE5E0_03600 [Terriglobia bacterium]
MVSKAGEAQGQTKNSAGKGKKDTKKQENEDIFAIWADSNKAVLKMWEDSCSNLYKPWVESAERVFETTMSASKESTAKDHESFYDDWMKTWRDTFGKFYPIPKADSTKESLGELLTSAEESIKLYKSWITDLEENSKITKELLEGKPNSKKQKEYYDMWMRSYEKIFDEFLSLPMMESTKKVFEDYTGIPDIYSRAFTQMLRSWRSSYARLYRPWMESMIRLSQKMGEISEGSNVGAEAYQELYSMWMDGFNQTFGKYARSPGSPDKAFEEFVQNTDIYLNLYRSWMEALQKMSEKASELLKHSADPGAYKDFYDLWVKTYKKAFDTFFEDMPMVEPMKQMMEPVRAVGKSYADALTAMSKAWVKFGAGTTPRV